ncbi:hypothetical protein RTE01_24640 [Raoultella terrigena]|nr:hypothetical protein RTE01_24640 [Raoultella terrigena]
MAAEAAKKSRLLTPGKTALRQDKNAGKQQGGTREGKEKAKRSKTGAKQAQKKLKGAEHRPQDGLTVGTKRAPLRTVRGKPAFPAMRTHAGLQVKR